MSAIHWNVDLDSISRALSVALLHSLWQVSLAAGLFALLRRFADASARTRHTLGLFLVTVQPVLLLWTFVAELPSQSGQPLDGLPGNLGQALPTPLPPAQPFAAPTAEVFSTDGLAVHLPTAIALLWILGVVMMSTRLLGGALVARRFARTLVSPLAAPWSGLASSLAEQLGVSRKVRFVCSALTDVPFTLGWLSPVVVVPTSLLTGCPAASVELLLRHELGHIVRNDYLWQLLQSVAESFLFFHPLLWWLSREVRAERELACDEAVVLQGVDRLAYARALTELEMSRQQPLVSPKVALSAAGGTGMKNRIVSIVAPRPDQKRATTGLSIAVALLVCSAGGVAACADIEVESPAAPSSELSLSERAPSSELNIQWLPQNVARHRSAIEAASRQARVDADIIALMVLAESGGDERALSPVGARGLMQLMPATATSVAADLNVRLDGEEALEDPELNLVLGASFLRKLQDADLGSTTTDRRKLAWASYNAGRKAVASHLDAGTALPDETVRYVALLESMYAERAERTSTAYEAWRARARDRVLPQGRDPLAGGRITSGFGHRSDPIDGASADHSGVDIAHAVGTPVVSPLDGTVVEARDGGDARGVFVVIRHRAQLESRFHHLGDAAVSAGQTVSAGDVIGTVGNTGVSTGAHLHFELRDQGNAIDPSALIDR